MRRNRNPNPARKHEWHAPNGQIYELIDAPKEMQAIIPPPGPSACARALPLDPWHCALAEQYMESFDVPIAQFGRDKCYLPLRRNGKIVVYRMKLRAKDRARIDHFDQTGEWPDSDPVIAFGIPPNETLDSRRSADKRLRERWTTIGHTPKKRATKVGMRDASRRAQVTVSQSE